MKSLTASFAIILMFLTAPVYGQDKPVKERLILLLSDRHYHPSEEAVKALGPGVIDALKEIALDESALIFRRVRAIHALGYFTDDDITRFLENRASAEGQLIAVRWSALRSLARLNGDKSVNFISRYLEDDNRFTRQVAGHSLKKIGSPKALKRLDRARREGRISK